MKNLNVGDVVVAELLRGTQKVRITERVKFISSPWIELNDGHVVHVSTIKKLED